MKLPQLRIGPYSPQFPIVQGGMAVRVSTSSLAGEVARCGGIGVIGATGMELDELKNEIRAARALAGSGVIGVNIMYAAAKFAELVHTALEEKIDIIFTGAGFSRDIFKWAKGASTMIVPIVSSGRAARLAERCGAPAVVAEGAEAGGHLGTDRSIKSILPEILSEIKIPVIAAGGMSDGFDMAEFFEMGAQGAQLATRFVLSNECSVADSFKQTMLKAKPEDITLIKSPVGLPGRAIRNAFVDRLEREDPPKPKKCEKCLRECSHVFCIVEALRNAQKGDINNGLVFSGQNVTRIKEILPVASIMEQLVNQCQEALNRGWNTRAAGAAGMA